MKVDTALREKTDLGMFYLCNNSINPWDVFLKDMPDKICTNFTCKGKECNNANCNFSILGGHPSSNARPFWQSPIISPKRDIGWPNEYHFMKMPNITDEIKKLLGNTKGPNSKTAWSICCLIPMRQIHRLQNLSSNCIYMLLISRHGSGIATENGLTSSGKCILFEQNYIVP